MEELLATDSPSLESEKSEGRWFQHQRRWDGEIETRLKAMGEGIYRDTTRCEAAVIK
jgi:hypothetical protein